MFLHNLWRWKCGLPETDVTPTVIPTLEELYETEWSEEFIQRMRNRLVMGAIRYGRMGHGKIPAGKPTYNRCESIRVRLRKFEETGNAEHLVDIANLTLLMYEEQYHPNFHFNSTDDGYHDDIVKR
jgi:hypothetical protein